MVKRKMKFEIYPDLAGEHRWRLLHGNGKIIADSAEGYKRRQSAERAAHKIIIAMRRGPVVVVVAEGK